MKSRGRSSGEIKDGVMLGRGTSDMKCGMGAFFVCRGNAGDAGVKLSGDVFKDDCS